MKEEKGNRMKRWVVRRKDRWQGEVGIGRRRRGRHGGKERCNEGGHGITLRGTPKVYWRNRGQQRATLKEGEDADGQIGGRGWHKGTLGGRRRY